MCNCKYCKHGRKRKHNRKMIRSLRRVNRQKVRLALLQGRYDDVPERISVPYTD